MSQKVTYNISVDIEKVNEKMFRYSYIKCWDESKAKIIAILFNPSKATVTRSDGTLDVLTEHFFKDYGGIVILNLFSYMCSNPKDIINTENECEIKNWKYVKQYVDRNKDKDFFIGWGNETKNVMKKSKDYISKQKDLEVKKQLKLELEENEEKIKNADRYANNRKSELENFFIDNNMQKNIYCFSSYTNKKHNKAMHPSKYDRYGAKWTYKNYF